MKNLQQAMVKRAEERREEIRELERIEALAAKELDRRRARVRELFIEHFSAEYDTDLSEVTWKIYGETFTVSAHIEDDKGGCEVKMLDAVLRLDDDGAFYWTGAGRKENKPIWRVRELPTRQYSDYDNLLDALIHAYSIDWRRDTDDFFEDGNTDSPPDAYLESLGMDEDGYAV